MTCPCGDHEPAVRAPKFSLGRLVQLLSDVIWGEALLFRGGFKSGGVCAARVVYISNIHKSYRRKLNLVRRLRRTKFSSTLSTLKYMYEYAYFFSLSFFSDTGHMYFLHARRASYRSDGHGRTGAAQQSTTTGTKFSTAVEDLMCLCQTLKKKT